MNLLSFFGRRTSKKPSEPHSEPVTLEPTPHPRAYRSPHSRPFQPQPQGEAETLGWLSEPTPTAVDSIVRTRDRAGYLVGTAQRTHATEETRRWLRAPTEGNLQRILQRREMAGGAPVLTSPSFPSLKEMVTDAGIDLASTTSDGISVEGRERVVLEPVGSPTNSHFEPLDEDVFEPGTRGRMGTQLGRRPGSKPRSQRRHNLDLQPPGLRLPEVPGPPNEEGRGRLRFRSPRIDWGELKRRYEIGELPPRPSRFPSHYDDEEEPPGAEIRTAMKGRVTRCQRMFSVSRPEPTPAEYLNWALASEEAFAHGEPSDKGEDVEGEPATQLEPESEPEDIPLQRFPARYRFSDSDSSLSTSSDFDDTPEEFHLQQLSKSFSRPIDTPRRTFETFFYRNPSALYHILTATVPNPRHEWIVSSDLDSLAKDELEMHIRCVKWALLDMGHVDRKERVMRKGPRVQRKVLRQPRRLREIDGMGEYIHQVRTRGLIPSKLRHCETAE